MMSSSPKNKRSEKGFFRREVVDKAEFLELTADVEPEFFAFLQDICDRAQTPMPHRVYACPNVNAGVYFDTEVLNLFRPLRKNLLVGLGMVNALNRTELEAVLAHEFGHVSKGPVRFDQFLHILSSSFEGLANETSPLPEVGRRISGFLLRSLRKINIYLSREMELQADRLAVEMTGSDALVHALIRTDWADQCYSQTLYDLEQAAFSNLRSVDFYFHQTRLMETMRERLGDPTLGIPPRLPEDPEEFIWAFDEEPEDRWNSHPSNRKREEWARKNYRRTNFDERSAWTLFADPFALRALLTDRLYQHRWKIDCEPKAASYVQEHLDGEHAEVLLDPDERMLYGHRFIEPGDLDEVLATAQNCQKSDEELSLWLQELTGPLFAQAVERVERHIPPPQLQVSPPPSSVPTARSFRIPRRRKDDSNETESNLSVEEDHNWLAQWDRQLLVATLCAALRSDEADTSTGELLTRYYFHIHLQDLIRWMRAGTPRLRQILAAINSDDLDEGAIDAIFGGLSGLYNGLQRGLLHSPPVPSLYGLPDTAGLPMLILEAELVDASLLNEGELDSAWLQTFVDQWQESSERLDHLRRKSLGALLFYQKTIIAPWLS